MATKTTGAKAATAASKVLSSKDAGAASKTAAASALTQTSSPKETTSARAATAASKVLRDGRTGADQKLPQAVLCRKQKAKSKFLTQRSSRPAYDGRLTSVVRSLSAEKEMPMVWRKIASCPTWQKAEQSAS